MILVFAGAPTPAAAKDTGRIEGQVTHIDGDPLAPVTVTVNGTSAAAVTDRQDRFVLKRIPAGTYTLTFTFLDDVATRSDVNVTAGSTTRVDLTVDWDMSLNLTVPVYSASRREEGGGDRAQGGRWAGAKASRVHARRGDQPGRRVRFQPQQPRIQSYVHPAHPRPRRRPRRVDPCLRPPGLDRVLLRPRRHRHS